MTKRQARQYEMLLRVRDFGRAHQDRFAEGGEGSKAFGVVAEAVDEIDAYNGGKQTARRVSKAMKLVAKHALAARLRAVAGAARVLAKTVPDADAKFPMPTQQSDVAVLQAGLLFRKEVAPVKDDFIRCGLPPTFAEDLQAAVTAFGAAMAGRQAGKTGSKVSQVAIRSALQRAVDAAKSLDVLVSIALGSDDKAMAAWKRDRRTEGVGRRAAVDAPEAPTSVTQGPAAHEGQSPASTTELPTLAPSTLVESDVPALRRAS